MKPEKSSQKKRQEDRDRRAREEYLARSPERWHKLVMSDGRKRNIWASSTTSKLVQKYKVPEDK